MGEYNNVTGNSFINTNGAGTSGNSMSQAVGGGAGPSAAETSAGLELREGDQTRSRVEKWKRID